MNGWVGDGGGAGKIQWWCLGRPANKANPIHTYTPPHTVVAAARVVVGGGVVVVLRRLLLLLLRRRLLRLLLLLLLLRLGHAAHVEGGDRRGRRRARGERGEGGGEGGSGGVDGRALELHLHGGHADPLALHAALAGVRPIDALALAL